MDHISHRMILFPERKMYRTFLTLILMLNTVHSEFGGNFTLSFPEFPLSISFSPKGDKAYFIQFGAQAILEYENDGFVFEYRRNVTCPSIISFSISASGIWFWPDRSKDFSSSKPPTWLLFARKLSRLIYWLYVRRRRKSFSHAHGRSLSHLYHEFLADPGN